MAAGGAGEAGVVCAEEEEQESDMGLGWGGEEGGQDGKGLGAVVSAEAAVYDVETSDKCIL